MGTGTNRVFIVFWV